MNGKNIDELIAEGSSKLASVPSGGASAAASSGAAAGGAAAEEKKEEKVEEKEESDDDSKHFMFSPLTFSSSTPAPPSPSPSLRLGFVADSSCVCVYLLVLVRSGFRTLRLNNLPIILFIPPPSLLNFCNFGASLLTKTPTFPNILRR